MNRVCIVCEGATEVEFVKGCLAPHLMDHGVSACPFILRAPSGGHRGGRVSVEGLLFSDVEQFQYVLDGWDAGVRQRLIAIRAQFPTPEDINNSRETAPSRRILAALPDGGYNKTEHGPVIAEAIGLATIRRHCPQFDAWVARLEAWGNG
ncbi:DUF4276 family protein (plasmid) [Tistrella mobilis]|uniref:DUF4276 domain-containing protein n=1 Tax=Tistrella mobilis TaxID=171437 RepID=A0A162LJX4_9PROT|nr:DUF4276 family protein [Tistrella mobilis]KYO55312.1 hypothetical protein AUP44_23755 [Tistrella mobilis]